MEKSRMTLKKFITEQFYNETLSPKFWTKEGDEYVFDERIADKLIEIAKNLAEEVDVDKFIEDIVLTGSLANYNYTSFSDLDVHILIDFDNIDENTELVKMALDGKRFKWNDNHNITIKDHDVELYFEDSNEEHISTGLYSLLNKEWIKIPEYNVPQVDEYEVNFRYQQIKRDIQIIKKLYLKNKNNKEYLKKLHNTILKYKDKVMKMRKDSLQKDGEFGEGNLVFKKMRNGGEMELMIKLLNLTYDSVYTESKKTFNKFVRNW
jgi:predicted nucleotidyltransferase